jgi:hypothetical protein
VGQLDSHVAKHEALALSLHEPAALNFDVVAIVNQCYPSLEHLLQS